MARVESTIYISERQGHVEVQNDAQDARVRFNGHRRERNRKFVDSPLEQVGFEPPVPVPRCIADGPVRPLSHGPIRDVVCSKLEAGNRVIRRVDPKCLTGLWAGSHCSALSGCAGVLEGCPAYAQEVGKTIALAVYRHVGEGDPAHHALDLVLGFHMAWAGVHGIRLEKRPERGCLGDRTPD